MAHTLPELPYAMDALESPARETDAPSQDKVTDFLARITRADVENFESLAEGKDLRLHGDGIVGGALEADGWVIHLSVFDMPESDTRQDRTPSGHRASRVVSLASRRRGRGTN